MIRKMCPICDNCIGAMNYCKTCHQFIWHPERREMRYYLNESHPAVEDYCEYHRESDYRQSAYGENQPVRTSPKSNSYAGSGANGKMTKADYLAKKAAQAAGSYRSDWKKMVERQADKEQQKKKNPVMQFLVIIFIYLVFSMISSFSR